MHHYARKYTTRDNARQANSRQLVVPRARTLQFQRSFFPDTIKSWNSLPSEVLSCILCLCLESHCKHSYVQSGFLCYIIFIFGYILELANSYLCMPLPICHTEIVIDKKNLKTVKCLFASFLQATLQSL